MDDYTYEGFLEGKIKDEHAVTHLLEDQVTFQKIKITKMLKDLSVLRKSQNDLKIRNKALEQKMRQLQMQLKSSKQARNIRAKQLTQKRVKLEKETIIEPKQIFKNYLDNTFPKHKGTLKRILKLFYVMQDLQNKQPVQKIKIYNAIFEGFVRKALDWLFPKTSQSVKNKSIAENMLKQWKQKQKIEAAEQKNNHHNIIKQAEYLKQIQKLQSQTLVLKAQKNQLQNRLKMFERSLQIKGGQFAFYLKKTLQEDRDIEVTSRKPFQDMIALFTQVADRKDQKIKGGSSQGTDKILNQSLKVLSEQVPQMSNDKHSKKKAAPILKKNIYGYYQDPQFAGNYTIGGSTKHPNNNKHTQTLSQDLCVLTLHPVMMVTLIDGNIKPQRTRHSNQYFVRIQVNQNCNIESSTKQGLQPVWHQPYLLKDYDFPFIDVSLMHKSKGLRDYSLGNGKLSASSQQQKIVNVRKQKQFHGRVRFSVSYPKGNIYEFKITSVKIQIPPQIIVLKQQVSIHFPYNPYLIIDYSLPENIKYLQKSVIILDSSDESMHALVVGAERKGEVSLKQFVQKQGNKMIVVEVQDGWRVILQGEVYLLICQDVEPERIQEDLLQGGKGKYFSVRAPHPIMSVTYSNTTLYSSIKFPLVFNLNDEINKLSIIRELQNKQISQEIVDPIVNPAGFLRQNEIIKAPSKIYKFFIETLQGEQVILKHQSQLFERLLKQIHLQISYKQDEIQEVNYARKGKNTNKDLYKQFTVQSKQLMLNHYKVFSKHFKRIGFVKFKLGYTIYDNELLPQSLTQSQSKIESLQPLKQGLYFIELLLSESHLTTKASGSSYKCILSNLESKELKGNNPKWNQSFILPFQLAENLQMEVKYQIWENGTFSKNKIYEGIIVVNADVLKLGCLIVSLDAQKKDCLHFSAVRIPLELYRLSINEIEAEIKEQADWIGKIDPYIIVQSQNRQLLRTQYLNDIGSHPIWKNINRQMIVQSSNQQNKEESFLQCSLYDYDLIGKNDYIGTIKINKKLNTQLESNSKSQILYGNIIKQNLICGSLKIRGIFEKIHQQKIKIPEGKSIKLSRKDVVYKLSIFCLHIFKVNEWKGDTGVLIAKRGGKKISNLSFSLEQSKLADIFLTLWGTQAQDIEIQLIRQYKKFFKSYSESLGSAVISIKSRQFNKGLIQIKLEGSTTATASFLCQPPNKIKYAQVKSLSYCKRGITLKSDAGDSLQMQQLSKRHIFYHKQFYFTLQDADKQVRLQARQISSNILGIYLPNNNHSTLICCVCILADNILSTQFQENSQRLKDNKYAQYFRLSYIHWQPYRYQSPSSYQFRLRTDKNKESITVAEKLNQVYNDYLLLKERQQSIVFEKDKTPDQIEVYNMQNQQRQAVISVNIQSKIFVSGKGVLYYKLQEYNHKSVTKLSFQYIYLRLQNPQILIGFNDIKLTIKSQLSYHTFQSQHLPNSSFLFFPFSMIISNSPNLSNIFFEAEITGTDSTSTRSIKTIKFGLRVQPNKKQYRVVDNQEFVVHSVFDCESIVRNYQEKAPIDNTYYGLSFIQIEQLQLELGEGSSKRRIHAQITLANQFQKFYLEKVGSTNVFKNAASSKLFIERFCILQVLIIEEGVLSSSNIGKAVFKLTDTMLLKEKVTIQNELAASEKIVGRCKLSYKNLVNQQFLDVNFFNYICQDNVFGMNAQMREIGEGKLKYQKMALSNKGNVQRLESDDSFIAINDPREYQITVNDRTTNKLFGEFKLYHETKIGQKIMILQPLRTSTNNLNGVLIIQYEKKMAKGSALQQTKNNQPLLVNIIVEKLIVKQYLSSQKESYSFRVSTAMRQNKSKMQQLSNINKQKSISFTLLNNQFGQFTLLQKDNIIGATKINPPYFEGQERILILQKQSVSAICYIRFEYIKSQEIYSNMLQITSLQATNLKDTELFVKMNPYVEIKDLASNKNSFITQLGIGKQSIFWKVGLLVNKSLQFSVMDKDLMFDDFVGKAKLDLNTIILQKQAVFEVSLIGQQNKQQKAGQLKVFASPLEFKFNVQSIIKEGIQQVKCYLLKLGGFTMSKLNLDRADRLIIELIYREGTNIILYNQYFKFDMFFYLAGKDIEVQFDNYYSKKRNQSYDIRVRLSQQNNIVYQQLLNSNTLEKTSLFSILTSLPLKKQFISFQKIYLWFNKKISRKLQIYLATKDGFNRLNVTSYQKNFILIQPIQLFQLQYGQNASILLKEDEHTQYRFDFKLHKQNLEKNKIIIHEKIMQKNKQEAGYFFCEISKYQSEGQIYQKKKMIGKSQKNWLNIQIWEAILTKDLELFSKMDPYCKFKIERPEMQWRKTSVQNDIGLHPIWNQKFLIDLDQNYGDEQMVFQVIDEEVTSDRTVGQGKATIKHLLKGQGDFIQVALMYKSNEPSGKLRVKASICNKYLIFRNILNLGGSTQPIIINQNNKASQKGNCIQLGQIYPIDTSKQFKIQIGKATKTCTWQQIRKENCLVFDQEELVLRFDIYE